MAALKNSLVAALGASLNLDVSAFASLVACTSSIDVASLTPSCVDLAPHRVVSLCGVHLVAVVVPDDATPIGDVSVAAAIGVPGSGAPQSGVGAPQSEMNASLPSIFDLQDLLWLPDSGSGLTQLCISLVQLASCTVTWIQLTLWQIWWVLWHLRQPQLIDTYRFGIVLCCDSVSQQQQ